MPTSSILMPGWDGASATSTTLWHVILTGYQADEHLGEGPASVAFSYAQTGGLGWGFIGLGAVAEEHPHHAQALDFFPRGGRRLSPRQARPNGCTARITRRCAELLDQVRRRLNIGDPVRYRAAQASLEAAGLKGI